MTTISKTLPVLASLVLAAAILPQGASAAAKRLLDDDYEGKPCTTTLGRSGYMVSSGLEDGTFECREAAESRQVKTGK